MRDVANRQLRSSAKALSFSKGMISSDFWCVRFKNTLGAASLSNASSQRAAHRHQVSPGFRPGKPSAGLGVERSLPRYFEKAKNSASICAQTVCDPVSSVLVLQQPSLKNPVTGSWPQGINSSPNTLNDGALFMVIVLRLHLGCTAPGCAAVLCAGIGKQCAVFCDTRYWVCALYHKVAKSNDIPYAEVFSLMTTTSGLSVLTAVRPLLRSFHSFCTPFNTASDEGRIRKEPVLLTTHCAFHLIHHGVYAE